LVKEIKTDLRTCRSNITKIVDYVVGDNNPKNAYIILRIQILPGRTAEVKHRVGKILLEKIHANFSDEIKNHDTQVRVSLTETDKQYYYGLDH
jgi:5-carboxymethyl-2-hydroxymuconate isomerase